MIRPGRKCVPEHPGFELRQVNDRSIVRLRVRPNGADTAGETLHLPQQPLQWRDGDPAACWLGPDQWLLTSDSKTARGMIADIAQQMPGRLYGATDMSSAFTCFVFKGPAARTMLAMGCGIDMDPGEFISGQCVVTNFANLRLLIVAVEDDRFELYVDRSHARYLGDWLAHSGEDPMTRDSELCII